MSWLKVSRICRNLVGSRARPARRRSACLRLEELEPRIVPADVWSGIADNNWFNAANWSAGVPTVNTTAVIPSGTPTAVITGTAQVSTLNVSGGTLVMTSGTIQTNFINLSAGTIAASGTISIVSDGIGLDNSGGTLEVTGPLTISSNAPIVQGAGGTLAFTAISSTSTAPLQISSSASFQGSLAFTIVASSSGSYPLLNSPSLSAAFTSVTAQLPAGFSLTSVTYLPTEIDAVIQGAPPSPFPSVLIIPPTTTTIVSVAVATAASSSPPTTEATPASEGMSTFVFLNNHNVILIDFSSSAANSGAADGGVTIGATQPTHVSSAGHTLDVFEVDNVLVEDVDQVLHVQSSAFATAVEQDVLSGVSIVRALLTGTTPRTDVAGNGAPAIATLIINTDDFLLPGGLFNESSDGPLGLSMYLIDPLRTYNASPGAMVLGPVTDATIAPSDDASVTNLTPWLTVAGLIGAGGWCVTAKLSAQKPEEE